MAPWLSHGLYENHRPSFDNFPFSWSVFHVFLKIAHLSVELVLFYRVGLRDGTWWQVERKIPAT